MALNLMLSFLGASMLLTLMPGPDNIYVLTESLTKGQKTGIAISVGLVSGVLVHTLAAATGLSIIIQKSALVFSVIKYLGAAYLFYLAFMAFKEKNDNLKTPQNPQKRPQAAPKSFFFLFRKGFLMNVLNPKVSLFFIAFLPQFITKNGFPVGLQLVILGIIFMVQALLIFSCISMLSGKFAPYLNSDRFRKATKWTKVGVLSLLGLTLAIAEK